MSATLPMARRNWLSAASNEVRGAKVCLDSCSGEDVITQARQGDQAAQRRLYEEYRGRVYRLMVRMVGTADAADVTQQVFLRVLRTISQFSGRSQFGTWLYRVAANEALQHLRRRGRSRSRTLDYEVVDRTPSALRQREQAELLEHALSRLDPDLHCVFLLREIEGLPYHDIAVALNIAEGTVGSQLNRARRLLRGHLIELGWQP